jgi:hypothetical protein
MEAINLFHKARMDRGLGLTGPSKAVQYNVTMQCGSLNEHLPETWTLLSWSMPRL